MEEENTITEISTSSHRHTYFLGKEIDGWPGLCVSRFKESSENGQLAEVPIYYVYVRMRNGAEKIWKKLQGWECEITYKVNYKLIEEKK